MTRRAAVFVVALVAAALVGVALLAIPGSPLEQRPTLGLDLQGGLEVTLQAVPPRDRKLTKEDLDRSVSIMRSADPLAAGALASGLAVQLHHQMTRDPISIGIPGRFRRNPQSDARRALSLDARSRCSPAERVGLGHGGRDQLHGIFPRRGGR